VGFIPINGHAVLFEHLEFVRHNRTIEPKVRGLPSFYIHAILCASRAKTQKIDRKAIANLRFDLPCKLRKDAG
jgi:hypothetical protein